MNPELAHLPAELITQHDAWLAHAGWPAAEPAPAAVEKSTLRRIDTDDAAAVTPATPFTYMAWNIVYALGVGLAYAAFTAVVLGQHPDQRGEREGLRIGFGGWGIAKNCQVLSTAARMRAWQSASSLSRTKHCSPCSLVAPTRVIYRPGQVPEK